MKRAFSIIILWLWSSFAIAAWLPLASTQQFTFYVDSINGNNANSGTSKSSPLKDITSLSAITNGQSIGLAGGSYWRQELRIIANNVTVGCYGNCYSRPILDGSDQYLNTNFTKTGGLTNVYQTTSITFAAGSTAAWINVFETGGPGDNATGSFLNFVANNATVDSTPCSYTISGMTPDGTLPATGQIFIHGCDPAALNLITNGYVYEFSNRPTGLYIQGNNPIVTGIETRKSADDLGSLQVQGDGAAATFTNVLARDGGKHNAFAPCGSTVTGSYFVNGYYSTTVGNLLVFFDNIGSGKPLSVIGSFFQQDQTLAGANPTAALQHTGSGNCGAVTFNSNWLIAKNSANLSGIAFSNVSSISTNGNFASQLQNYISPGINMTVTNDQYVSDLNNNTPVVAIANNITLTLVGAKICSSHNQNGLIFNNASTGLTYNITNSLLYLNTPLSGAYPFAIAFQIGAAITLNVNGSNLGSANSEFYNYNMFVGGNTFTGNNNIYELSATTHWVKDGSTFNSLAAWKAAVSPQDAASVTTGGNAVSACTLPTIPVIL
jgi:hypothetical protein